MDPNTVLSDMLQLAGEIIFADENSGDGDPRAVELAEKVEALDEWLKKGGFCPARWGAR